MISLNFIFLMKVKNYNLVFQNIDNKNFIYYILIILSNSSILLKKYFQIQLSKFHYNHIKNPLLRVLILILIQYPISIYISNSYIKFWFYLIIGLIFLFLYVKIGYLITLLLIFYYIEDFCLFNYMNTNFDTKIIIHLNYYFNFSNLSLLISILFLFIIYYEGEMIKVYNKIYLKIFCFKIILDIFLILNFVYNIYEEYKNEFFINIYETIHIIYILLTIHYMIILLGIFLKLNFRIDTTTYDSLFKHLYEIEKIKGNQIPYFEIKFLKVCNFKKENEIYL